jgi:protoheme ferro-lyase
MLESAILYLALVVLSIGAGYFFVRYLVVHPLKMSLYLLGTCVVVFGMLLLLAAEFQGGERWMGVGFAVVFALASYFFTARAELNREDARPLPALTRAKDDPGLGHTAVVYFTHGEPELYDPIGWINQFKEFDKQKIRFVPLVARPFFLYQLRKGYLRIGRSDHHQMHQRMLNSLERAYREEGNDSTRFYLCFLDDHPRPDAAVIQALNDGASRIIVMEVFLTISNHTAEGKALIEELHVEEFGVPLHFTGPMYDSEKLKSVFVQRSNRNIGGLSKSQIGVLLVGHGQPDEWDEQWPTETSQEIRFRKGVLELLAQDGYSPQNLSLAWMEFKQPKPAEKVEELARNGVKKVLFFSAAISADSMHSQYDVPELMKKARVSPDVEMVNLGAWNDDPIVIQAIKEKVDALMDVH